uniref:PNPLA domain-containing protein n=1 Tax=Tetradesmus obliquus TaxID=3088 RepID=A0A383VF18_TETOB|eukprot:jgi/Sobl393_1/4312/SZX63533.1
MRWARVALFMLACAALLGCAGARRPLQDDVSIQTHSHRKKPAVAYQGSAFLMGYYAGVSQALLEAKPAVLVPGRTITGGLSGGAWSLISAHLGYSGEQLLKMWADLFTSQKAKDLLQSAAAGGPGLVGHINTLAVRELAGKLPDNPQHTLNGCMRVAISQLDSTQLYTNNSASWIVDRWQDRADVQATLLATNYISCYSGPTVYTYFRNQPVIDGGYSSGFKQLCPGGRLRDCIKAASYYVGSEKANTTCDTTRCSSGCGSHDRTNIITTLYQNGPYVDRWKLFEVVQRCPPTLWSDGPPYASPDFVPQATATKLPDIYPGRYNDLPEWPPGSGRRLLACEWQNFAMVPPTDRITEWLNVTYQQGYADAQAWVRSKWG